VDIPRPKQSTRRPWYIGGAVVVGLVLVTWAASRLQPAAPTVERGAVWIDSVKRGPMVREVRGPGKLVPEQIRWISAVTGGRVDRVDVRPGAVVQPNSVLLEMSNPDVQLEALTAEQQLGAAEAQLVSLRTSLETGRLNQTSVVAQARMAQRDAQRAVLAAETLATRNLIAPNDLAHARDALEEATTRLRIEEQRLQLMASTVDSQISLQRDQVSRLRAIAEYQKTRVASMRVTAGTEGVVQELSLEPGQWVMSGATLARVVQPGRLKAVLQIPETQARDVALGQQADVDTRIGHVKGRVIRMDPASENGTVSVDIGLDGALPQGARPDLTVEGTIEIDRLADVLSVGPPALAQPNASTTLFKLESGGRYADRVQVRLGRASVNAVEVLEGLKQGDQVILSDMSRWDNVDRVRVK
jgi:HlyD family secretion protein